MLLAFVLGCGSPASPADLPEAPPAAPAAHDGTPAPAAGAVTANALPSGLCRDGEKAVFACTVASGKALAVCAGADTVQYRFGPPGSPELVFPADSDPKKLKIEERNYVQSMATVLSFENDGVTYEVTDASGGGGQNGETNNFQGVYVLKGGSTLTTLRCASEPVVDWAAGPGIPRAP